MKTFALTLIMTLLTAFVFYAAARIEILNAQAGYYLPRQDKNSNDSFDDGKWRISVSAEPRDELRAAVMSYGLMQYLLAPFLLILSVFVLIKSKNAWTKILGGASAFVSLAAIYLMFYREYLSSLG